MKGLPAEKMKIFLKDGKKIGQPMEPLAQTCLTQKSQS